MSEDVVDSQAAAALSCIAAYAATAVFDQPSKIAPRSSLIAGR